MVGMHQKVVDDKPDMLPRARGEREGLLASERFTIVPMSSALHPAAREVV